MSEKYDRTGSKRQREKSSLKEKQKSDMNGRMT